MRPATGVPLRPLVALTVLVLLAHGLALRAAPPSLSWERVAAQAPQLRIRSISPAADTPPVPAPAPVVPAAPMAPAPQVQAPHAMPAPAPPIAAAGTLPQSDSAAAEPQRSPAALVPAAARWHYVATARSRGVPLSGQAQLQWRPDGTTYEATLQVTVPPLPARLQRSEGALAPDGLAPTRFSERTRSELATHFDRAQGRIVFSSNRPDVPLQPGAQDRLSVLLQLAALAAGEPARFVPGASVAVQVAGPREADTWLFTVDGPEPLALPPGALDALRLTRLPAREYDLKLELWLAPGADYVPARLRLTAPNGDWLDLQWSGTDNR